MNGSIFRITLDLHRSAAPYVLFLKQGDTARGIGVTLVEDGAPYEITDGATAVCCAKLPDGSTVGAAMTKGAELFLSVPYEWTRATGEVQCEIRVFNETGGLILTSPRFSLVVTETLFSDAPIEVYYGIYKDWRDVRVPGALAHARSVVPGEEAVERTVKVTGDDHLIVLVPNVLGITPTFTKGGEAQTTGGGFETLVDRYGVSRAYTYYETFSTGTWVVTIPALTEGE